MANLSLQLDRRDRQDKDISADSKKDNEVSQSKQFPIVLEIICMIMAAAIGFTVYKATGLCDSVESTLGHIAYGGGIIMYLVLMFRVGLHR